MSTKTQTHIPEGYYTPTRKASLGDGTVEADDEFVVTEGGTEDDDEQTLEEEEKMEEDLDHKDEIDNLQKEGSALIQMLLRAVCQLISAAEQKKLKSN